MPAAAAGLPSATERTSTPVALRQADRAAQAPRDARRRDRDAEAHAARAPRRSTGARRASARCSLGRDRDDQPAVEPDRVQAEQPPVEVDQRAAAGAARQRGGVLDAAGDRAPARAAEVAARRRHEPGRGAQAAPAAVRERDHRRADRRRRDVRLPFDGLDVAGVDARPRRGRGRGRRRPRGRVSRRPSAKLTVTSSPRRLWAFVRTRPGATTTPLPRPQPRPKPTTAGPTRSRRVLRLPAEDQ